MAEADFRKVLGSEEHLAIFLRAMKKFETYFCANMTSGDDFTLRMEIHGAAGRLAHCRVYNDAFDRPKDGGSPKNQRKGRE